MYLKSHVRFTNLYIACIKRKKGLQQVCSSKRNKDLEFSLNIEQDYERKTEFLFKFRLFIYLKFKPMFFVELMTSSNM